MVDTSWTKSIAWVRESEGGNDDDPADTGGRTSRGITQKEWNAYCMMVGLPASDVWKAPDGAIDDIYHRSYWLPYCPTLPPGVDYVFFDEFVNAGLHAAVEMLQIGLGFTGRDVDGHMGVITSAALAKCHPVELISRMSEWRVSYYKQIEIRRPVDRKYDRGWMNRVSFCEHNALTLVPDDNTEPA